MNLFIRHGVRQQIRIGLRSAIIGGWLLFGLGTAGCSQLQNIVREATPTPHTTTRAWVSADQIALAMQEDRFYADFGQSQLILSGTVASITQKSDHSVVEFQTSGTIRVQCELDTPASNVHPGDQITLEEPDTGTNVIREQGIIYLKNCHIP